MGTGSVLVKGHRHRLTQLLIWHLRFTSNKLSQKLNQNLKFPKFQISAPHFNLLLISVSSEGLNPGARRPSPPHHH